MITFNIILIIIFFNFSACITVPEIFYFQFQKSLIFELILFNTPM